MKDRYCENTAHSVGLEGYHEVFTWTARLWCAQDLLRSYPPPRLILAQQCFETNRRWGHTATHSRPDQRRSPPPDRPRESHVYQCWTCITLFLQSVIGGKKRGTRRDEPSTARLEYFPNV